ncbi:formylglycine-generating enzyme family protein [Aliivibrio finisterrensis]|uniref:SUMF1/EgtB/PvdO family nonheme iron enzyme n=1 Tax=Aliivibrio finisterrensis TaxID=511998 RepID=A0A6N6RYN7_9GAMM|nr:SUMF1/EgtB/PvdO family nonheme iron enzyme [Aliivibrio finisterrensis]KAB2826464.1 SUMF1/EgtB/PvdO family nonheme iron enzyme [Aliivibrio finisterrensis]
MKRYLYFMLFIFFIFIMFISSSLLFRTLKISTDSVEFIHDEKQLHPLDEILFQYNNFIHKHPFIKKSLIIPESAFVIKNKYIHQCEVSQKEFNLYLNSYNDTKSTTFNHRISGQLNSPATGIDFEQAKRYCSSRGGRLPTASEWEAAAKGLKNNLYPWGNTFIYDDFPYLDPLLNTTKSCAKITNTATTNQIYDLGGNVSEWVVLNNKAAIKGPNGFDKDPYLSALNFTIRLIDPNKKSNRLGFRCIFDLFPKGEKISKIPDGNYTLGVPKDSNFATAASLLNEDAFYSIVRKIRNTKSNSSINVGIHEITVAQYNRFLMDPLIHFNLFSSKNQPYDHSYIPLNWESQLLFPKKPVTGVDWWSAYAFASWSGGRLPTQEEWSYLFLKSLSPGTQQSKNITILEDASSNCPSSKTSICGLNSHVSEWSSSISFNQEGTTEAIYKGGNYKIPSEQTNNPNYMQSLSPYYRSDTLGFRVVNDN